MDKFYITKVGNVFDYIRFKEDEEQPDNMWLKLEVDYRDGIISVQIIDQCWKHLNNEEKFHLDNSCAGNYWHESRRNIFELGWNIKEQSGKSHTLIITGVYFNNSLWYFSIVRGICRFLNELYQYDTIEDYLAFKEVCDSSEWKSKDVCDKIVSLAKVIELNQKYKSINPALRCVWEMEQAIEKRLKDIIESEQDEQ